MLVPAGFETVVFCTVNKYVKKNRQINIDFVIASMMDIPVEDVPDVRAVVGFDAVPVERADPMVDDLVTVLLVVVVFFVIVDVAPALKKYKTNHYH